MFDLCAGVTCLRGTRQAPREVLAHDGFEVRAGGVDAENRRVTAYASTGAMDSYETVFEPKAFKKHLSRYMKNPIVLGQHSRWLASGEPPVIGKCVEAAIDDTGLKVVVEFAQGGVADLWWERYSKGFMRGFSQSSQVVKSEWRDRPDGTGRYLVFTEVRLREISCVDIPSCDEALARAYAPGGAPGRRGVSGSGSGGAGVGNASDAMDAVQGQLRGLLARMDALETRGDEGDALKVRVRDLTRRMDELTARGTRDHGRAAETPARETTTQGKAPGFAGIF